MAEQLGEASLRLTVDLEAFRQGLQDAKRLVQQELGGSAVAGSTRSGGSSRRAPVVAAERQERNLKELDIATVALTKARRQEANQLQQALTRVGSRAGGAVSSGLIGGAFPALFGQGAGASAGGLIGGTVGGLFGGAGGFAGGLVGTLAGAQVDNLGNVAKALDQPIAKFKELQDAGLISSKALEKTIQSLISAGRVSEAEALIRQDVAKRGLDAATANRLSEESDRLKRALADLGVSFALVAQGPLTQFINLLNNALQPGAVAARSKEVQSQLSPKDRQAFLARREQLKAEGGMNIVDINKKLIGEFESRTVAAKKGAQDIAAAREKDSKFLSLNYKLISAQSQGQKKNALELEKQLVTEQKLRDLKLNPDQAGEIELKARMRLYELTEQQKQLEQDLLAQRLQQNVEAAIAAKNIQQRLADARQLAGVEAGVTRQAIQQGQEIRAGVQAARDRVTSIGAQIDALRIQGGDNGPQLSKLVDEQVVASEEVRLKLIEGATALRDAGKQLRDDLKAAKLTLADTVNDPNGLNKFLTPEQQGQRAQQQLQQLLPVFRIAQQQFTQRTGATAPEFTGSSTDVVSAVTDFIRRVDAEINAGRDVNSIQQALAQNTADLVSINTQLATVVQELAGKNWLVNVNVPGGTASGDVVGALNGAL